MRKRLNRLLGNVSPWVVIGMSAILMVMVLALAFMNYNRENDYMSRILSEKGAALIRSFEAGTRTGIRGMFGEGPNLQVLLHETASQPDILYIAIVDSSGEVLAHSDAEQIGKRLLSPPELDALKADGQTRWRVIHRPDSPKSFEAYKLFLPILPKGKNDRGQSEMQEHMQQMMQGRKSGQGMMSGSGGHHGWKRGGEHQRILDPAKRPVIFIGMDVAPFEEAVAEDISHTFVMSGILLLLGLTGVVSLFWMQNYLRSRKQLTDIEALTAEMVASIPEGIVVYGPDDRITYVNDIAIRLLSSHPADRPIQPGEPAQDALPHELLELRASVDKDNPVVNTEMDLITSAGSRMPISVVITDILTGDGTFVGQMLLIRDMTQVRLLQEQIRKADKMAAIGHLAAGVAHEVRNPLSSIKGYATYFGTLFPEDSENRKAAQVMTAEVERLNRVITELLEMSRPADIKIRSTDIAALLESSLRLVKQEAEAAGVIISVQVPSDMETITLDPDRLTQAMINLYINAIQSMPQGGQLTVTAAQQGAQLLLHVRDTGTGLPEGTAKRIFDPYYTTKNTGTGLGLAIVHKIVEAHGGTIEVERTGPDGTTFTILLPIGIERGPSS